MFHILKFAPVLLLTVLNAETAFYTPKEDLDSLSTKATDNSLPNVLIIGDSISIGYTSMVADALDGIANVSRPVNRPNVNCGDTRKGLKDLSLWLGDKEWDVIHFNWGLHDLCYRHPDSKVYGQRDKINGTISVPLEEYKRNLRILVERLEETSAKLIWASTTMVPEGEAGRFTGDEFLYNEAAKGIMDMYEIPINDLHKLTLDFDKSLFSRPGDVHFRKTGYQKLANQVVSEINKLLSEESNKSVELTSEAPPHP